MVSWFVYAGRQLRESRNPGFSQLYITYLWLLLIPYHSSICLYLWRVHVSHWQSKLETLGNYQETSHLLSQYHLWCCLYLVCTVHLNHRNHCIRCISWTCIWSSPQNILTFHQCHQVNVPTLSLHKFPSQHWQKHFLVPLVKRLRKEKFTSVSIIWEIPIKWLRHAICYLSKTLNRNFTSVGFAKTTVAWFF